MKRGSVKIMFALSVAGCILECRTGIGCFIEVVTSPYDSLIVEGAILKIKTMLISPIGLMLIHE